jgi:hypothetical protein
MPPLVRRYIKTSFLFLMLGLLLGGYLVVSEMLLGVHPPRLLISTHTHLVLVGFMLMVVMGVATWMFPRPAHGTTRYRPGLTEAVYWLLTGATAVRAGAEIVVSFGWLPALRILIAVGGLGQIAGAVLFVANMWTRVRMPTAVPPAS